VQSTAPTLNVAVLPENTGTGSASAVAILAATSTHTSASILRAHGLPRQARGQRKGRGHRERCDGMVDARVRTWQGRSAHGMVHLLLFKVLEPLWDRSTTCVGIHPAPHRPILINVYVIN
jgi:hypothetical protein